MNGFLSSLIVRSREPLDSVRPRVPSLFEPAASSDLAAFDIELELQETNQPKPAVAAPAQLEPAHKRNLKEVAARPPSLARPHVVERETRFIETRVERERHTANETPAFLSQIEMQPEVARSHKPAPQPANTMAPTAPGEEPHRIDNASEPERAPIQRASAVSEPSVRHEFIPERRATFNGIPVTASNAFAALTVPAARRPRLQPASAKQDQPATEPVIEVSIGRIEVRAVQESARTPKSRPDTAVMTLQDYLKTRARERRS
jgi:hypothetical protein